MKLKALTLRNFKGVRDFHLEPHGLDVAVYGDNGVGKTTLFDAFTWLLFGKDSLNRTDFEVKALDPDGNPMHGLEHEVTAVLGVDGKELTLRKVLQEKWTKKRGSAEADFTGHTTDHWVNGVPAKEKEYRQHIDALVKEDVFKLLTNPRYFNEVMHWQERRKLLLEVCGDITDADVIASDSQLADLPAILNGRAMEDHKKVVAGERQRINKELEKIPTRIDEVQRGLPQLPKADEATLTKLIAGLEAEREAKQQEKVRLEAGGGIAEKTKQLRELEAQALDYENRYRAGFDAEIQRHRSLVAAAEDQASTIRAQARQWQTAIEENNAVIMRQEQAMAELRDQWQQVNAQTVTYQATEACPTCGQSLPAEQVQAARDKALSSFNQQKATTLEKIAEEGKQKAHRVDELKKQNTLAQAEIDKTDTATADKKVADVKASIAELTLAADSAKAMPEYLAIIAKKEQIDAAIGHLRAGHNHEVEAINTQVANLTKGIDEYEKQLATFQQRWTGDERIRILKDQERQLAKSFEALERELYLCDQFTRSKVRLLEEKINSKFAMARFKLFSQLVNGGIEECCETAYLGVPYSSLNNGARVAIGLDIIRTLQAHYGIECPVWIDNREAITRVPDMACQVVSLYVSEPDKELRVEYAKEEVTV